MEAERLIWSELISYNVNVMLIYVKLMLIYVSKISALDSFRNHLVTVQNSVLEKVTNTDERRFELHWYCSDSTQQGIQCA